MDNCGSPLTQPGKYKLNFQNRQRFLAQGNNGGHNNIAKLSQAANLQLSPQIKAQIVKGATIVYSVQIVLRDNIMLKAKILMRAKILTVVNLFYLIIT